MKFIKTPVKGMCDMLPADMRLREHILQMIKTSYAAYGCMQIETPVMEHIENLTSKQGGDNEKLIFKVMKRGADLTRAIDAGKQEFADNGLRYDLTVPLARYYANNKEKLPTPLRRCRSAMYGALIILRKVVSVSSHSVILIFSVMTRIWQRSSL